MQSTIEAGRLTRREYIASGSAFVGAGVLAGCHGADDPSSATGGSYTAELAPVGEVGFDSVPENVYTMYNQYADMLVALGRGDAVDAMFVPDMAGPTMNHYYDRLDGVSFDWEGIPSAFDNLSPEFFFGLDSDVHLLDPAWLVTQDNWTTDDIERISERVAPFFGNFYSGTHDTPPEAYRDRYDYYTLWELFGAVADIFRERERYEQLKAVYDDLVETIETDLPPESERPTAVRVTLDDGNFWTYHLNRPGFWLADTRPLAANDAFGDEQWDGLWGTVGYETMFEADPDVILHLWGMTPRYRIADVREQLGSHPVGRRLSAVENDRVYAHGMRYHGPLMNLFQIEMTAKQLYPEQFGEWPAYDDGDHYPEIPADEQLFDRDRVANIVTGN